jgi:hypothetical protein
MTAVLSAQYEADCIYAHEHWRWKQYVLRKFWKRHSYLYGAATQNSSVLKVGAICASETSAVYASILENELQKKLKIS